MKQLLLFIGFSFLISCNGGSNKPTQAMAEQQQVGIKEDYTILFDDNQGSYSNYEILVDSATTEPEVLVKGGIFKRKQCESITCNNIGIWKNKDAYTLYANKTNDPAWRKRYWPFVCENYIAEYNITVGEINLYPFMDSEYRRWGGKKKRPKPSSFDI